MTSSIHSPPERSAALVGLAAAAIARALRVPAAGRPADSSASWLAEPGATFVTLTLEGSLRGCIGSLERRRPLGEDVERNALAAAFQDPRFPALTASEWGRISLTVSELGAPRAVAFDDETSLLAHLRPAVDGLILEHGSRRATFLPQVWRHLPDPAAFVSELKRKAGLGAEPLAPDARAWTYEVVEHRSPDVPPPREIAP